MDVGREEADGSDATDEASDNDEESQEASMEANKSANGPLQWQSGSVAAIEEGGRDVQSVLDSEGVKLGIIHWHAPWIEACLELQPYLQRSALAHARTAFIAGGCCSGRLSI